MQPVPRSSRTQAMMEIARVKPEAHAKAVHRRGQRPVFAGEGFRAGKYYAVNHYQRYEHAQARIKAWKRMHAAGAVLW